MSIGQTEKITALYERLSRDADSHGDKLRQLPTISTKDWHDNIHSFSTNYL